MALKRKGIEPTYTRVVALCPKATLNPATNRPVSKKRIYDTLREDCFDSDTEEPWCHKARYAKSALPDWVMGMREACATFFLGLGHSATWYYKWVVWCDICNSILPRTENKANEQALARKRSKGWQSPGCEERSSNRRGTRRVSNRTPGTRSVSTGSRYSCAASSTSRRPRRGSLGMCRTALKSWSTKSGLPSTAGYRPQPRSPTSSSPTEGRASTILGTG